MDALFLTLYEQFESYIKKEESVKLIEEAYLIASKYHEGQLRRTGEPYITHPIAVATILADLHAGPATIIAALLHDTVEDTEYTLDEARKQFGEDIADLVDGVTKINRLDFKVVSQAENQQKMLLAMARDIRVVLIKISDRLHNVRTLEAMPPDKQLKIARETLDIYAPLAHRLGIFKIKAELEDISLRYVDPPMYYRVANLIQMKRTERESSIETIMSDIQTLFEDQHIESFEIKGRIKNIYSIYKKMVRDQRAFEDIYDLLAVRIIVPKIESCYQALGIIHAHYTPLPRRFKDYISVPKPNMYQSLHTTLLSEDGTLFEVQIRTPEMDSVAELGIAAHWAYKENKVYSKDKEQFEIAQKLKWYGELMKMTTDEDEVENGPESFVDTVKGDILDANVYVFTPKGEVIELPKGSTPIDFAYRIHTDVGHKMVGATVNNRIVTIDYELKTGDIVSVKTNKNSIGPSEDWIKIAKSSHAKHKIRSYLNKLNYDDLMQFGKSMLEREMVANKVNQSIDDNFAKKHFDKHLVETVEELYVEIGKGLISPKTVIYRILGQEVDRDQFLQRQMEKTSRQLTTHSETGIIVEGLKNPQIKLANCCSPIPGDDVVGYVSKTGGIVVHATFCPNLAPLDDKRFIEVFWSESTQRKYPLWLKIRAMNTPKLIGDVVTAVNAAGLQIAEIKAVNQNNTDSLISLKISVNHIQNVQSLMVNIRKIPDVYQVERDIQ
jgi:GTP diphosphokinase / guanosine-3',5'-bis(diphosphate) 3'-diphosphatase